jgi:hypothetical protein
MNLHEMLPRPDRAWEGWFFIAVGRRGTTVRFAKWHLFRASGRGHPIAAVEGLRGPAELCTFVGTAERVLHQPEPLGWGEIDARPGALALAVGDRFHMSGGDGVTLRAPGAELSCRPRDRLEWARWPFLHYVGFPGPLAGRLTAFGAEHRLEGTAIVEHAWGSSLPFDPLRVRAPWQWDVLCFDDEPDAPLLAALSIALPFGRRAVRVRGRLPGGARAEFTRHRVDYLDGVRRWRGRMHGPAGELDYEAVAATPAAEAFPGGAFLGFDFAGRWRRGGQVRAISGSGFAEHRP